jgi:hypothetical protein
VTDVPRVYVVVDIDHNLVASHHIPWSSVPAPPAGPLAIALAYDRTSLAVDETVAVKVTVLRRSRELTRGLLT